jgi:hypothetical protein
VCIAGYPSREPVVDAPGLDLLIPVPRESPENVRIR